MDQKLTLEQMGWGVQTDRKSMKRNIGNEKGGINKDTRWDLPKENKNYLLEGEVHCSTGFRH